MDNDKAAQAREGLVDSLAGKAKEVAGAVTGRDDLVEEGQLQQTESANRKDAVAEESLAGAKRDEANRELREANSRATAERRMGRAQADEIESAAQRQRDAEHEVAERDAARQEAAGRELAEDRAEAVAESRLRDAESLEASADATEVEARDEQSRLASEAAAADQQAARLRAETEK